NRAYAVGDSGTILRSDNGGVSWQTLPWPAGIPRENLYGICRVTADNYYAVGSNGTILYSPDGNNWAVNAKFADPDNHTFENVAFVSTLTGIAVGEYGEWARTTD